jgi:hypothetical protein
MRVSAGRSDAILRSAGTSSRSDTTPWGRGLRAPPMATVIDPFEARLLEPSRNRRDVFGRSETGPADAESIPACRCWFWLGWG